MTNLSTILINSAETAVILPDIPKYDICLVSKSSHYVTQLAETGNVQDFEQLIKNDPSKLTIFSPAGLCAAHNAAARNRVGILTLIVRYHGDLNIEDKNGWTPLHHAVQSNALNAIKFLLEHGVDSARLNKQQNAPIHLAIIHNRLDALKIIISKHPYQVDLPGERKKTPLHYAALIDNVEATKILTNNHACLCLRSDVGNYPIHEAALNSSNRVFNHLCEIGKVLFYLF
ncbi:unnamed protein product [Adineta steineri]|uniref:Uncharacterized protein n=1 Tax=Adineta steineri TaxID=433720 RepID=A0A816CVV2_9BILA|nr:unnamed protein product [Adineta steineri]CAF1626937.1 unnamed protein product [Adineta steineri]